MSISPNLLSSNPNILSDPIPSIVFVVASRANYARCRTVISALSLHSNLIKVRLVLCASAVLDRYGDIRQIVNKDGFAIDRVIHFVVEGGTLDLQCKSTALGLLELSSYFSHVKPSAVFTVADRYETMATAIASAYMNIPLIHIQGGDVSGNIDDKVRNSISMLADYHFPTSPLSYHRLLDFGIDPSRVHMHGCPAIDIVAQSNTLPSSLSLYKGSGTPTDWSQPYLLVLQHPVTTSYGKGLSQILETLHAVHRFTDIQKVILWPNVDAGTDDVAKGIRHFREHNECSSTSFIKNFNPDDYGYVLRRASVAIGNSSSLVREASFLGTPSVVIGDRQKGREVSENAIFCSYNRDDIFESISSQLVHGRYPPSYHLGKGDAGQKIANSILNFIL